MRGRSLVVTATALVTAVLAFSAAPASAQPTTPVPTPSDPTSPPMSAPVGPVPPGRAVGDAGTGLGILRLLPNSVPTKAIVPDLEDKLPKQAAAELGFGLATAQANSEAYLAFERSIAQAAPGGLAIQGGAPRAPGALAQTAPPDNPEPTSSGLSLPKTPLDTLIRARLLNGQVHARWSDTAGPCVGTISDASTEIASLSLLNAIPTLPDVTDLTGLMDSPSLEASADQAIVDGLKKLAGPLSTLGGVLSGGDKPKEDGTGSLLSLPNTLSARSTVQLVDIPGSPNKAVRSTSTMQVATVNLLAGTPFAIELRVVSQPTLQVTSTGDKATSTVRYTAPVIEVVQGGTSLGRLDTANPTLDIPIGIPLPGVPGAADLPIIGSLLANGQKVADAVSQGLQKLDLGVLRIGVAQLNEKSMAMTDPFEGFQLGATARMLDVQVLPTQALGLPNLPSALAQVSLGEQVARAYAPTGGVVCRDSGQPAPPPTPQPQGKGPSGLAYTTLAYKTIPMFWAGTAMLLIGVVLVAALPGVRPRRLRPYIPAGTLPDSDPPTRATEWATDTAPETETETETETAAGLGGAPGVDAEPEAEAGPGVETEARAGVEGGAEAVAAPGVDAQPGADAEPVTEEAAAEVKGADTEPVAEAATEPESEADPEPGTRN